jgi:hypothetical protein
MHTLLLCSSLSLSTLVSYAQTVFDTAPISASAITEWATATPKAYEGVYHFGESEAESDFVLVVSDRIITAQIRSGEWQTEPDGWHKVFRTLTNVRVVSNKFYSREMEGDFVTFINEGKYWIYQGPVDANAQ